MGKKERMHLEISQTNVPGSKVHRGVETRARQGMGCPGTVVRWLASVLVSWNPKKVKEQSGELMHWGSGNKGNIEGYLL